MHSPKQTFELIINIVFSIIFIVGKNYYEQKS